MTAAIYARVSTVDQTCENQLLELRRYCKARGWSVWAEFLDNGVSGSKDRRPALDDLLGHARRRRFDVLVCWRLDRLGRSLRHLVTLLGDLHDLGIGFVSLGEGIDLGTPAGRLQLHILAALAEFERCRIQERLKAGLARVKAEGRRLGRPTQAPPWDKLVAVADLSIRDAARKLRVSRSTVQRWRAAALAPPDPE
jgi:DNA invertase Pin-like site-specific DNA recombinase